MSFSEPRLTRGDRGDPPALDSRSDRAAGPPPGNKGAVEDPPPSPRAPLGERGMGGPRSGSSHLLPVAHVRNAAADLPGGTRGARRYSNQRRSGSGAAAALS